MKQDLESVVRFRISADDHKAAQQAASDLGMNLSQYVRYLIRKSLNG